MVCLITSQFTSDGTILKSSFWRILVDGNFFCSLPLSWPDFFAPPPPPPTFDWFFLLLQTFINRTTSADSRSDCSWTTVVQRSRPLNRSDNFRSPEKFSKSLDIVPHRNNTAGTGFSTTAPSTPDVSGAGEDVWCGIRLSNFIVGNVIIVRSKLGDANTTSTAPGCCVCSGSWRPSRFSRPDIWSISTLTTSSRSRPRTSAT